MSSFKIQTVNETLSNDQIKENEMGGACRHRRGKRVRRKLIVGKQEQKWPREGLGIGDSVAFKSNFKEKK
jgi:hypothetical protein